MKFAILAVLTTISALTAFAQTVYQPPRYQYGQYSEIYYGGTNPILTSNNYAYLPETLAPAYTSRRQNSTLYPYPSPYQFGPNSRFISPHFQNFNIEYQVNINPLIFSDYLPYEEVGQFGYTINDARNEAYANVPRLQTMARPIVIPAANIPSAQPAAPAADLRAKAIPLLDWAKVEFNRNQPLYKALIHEANKYDHTATEALNKQLTKTD